MRLLTVISLFLFVTELCAEVRTESERLQKLLRQKGVDALIEEVVRPQREFWQKIKAALLDSDGSRAYSEQIKSAVLPELSGTLISETQISQTEHELVLGVSAPGVPDVTLRLDSPLRQKVEPGVRVLFVGVAIEFRPTPFMLVLRVKSADVSFLPRPSL
jgi:hypothetical protein